ncbi:MAG: hypothetical protein PHQ27_07100 [Victivallales bacterium]|nr:hypothetical protein [Victivallales bacterium]
MAETNESENKSNQAASASGDALKTVVTPVRDPMSLRDTDTGNLKRMAPGQAKKTIKLKPLTAQSTTSVSAAETQPAATAPSSIKLKPVATAKLDSAADKPSDATIKVAPKMQTVEDVAAAAAATASGLKPVTPPTASGLKPVTPVTGEKPHSSIMISKKDSGVKPPAGGGGLKFKGEEEKTPVAAPQIKAEPKAEAKVPAGKVNEIASGMAAEEPGFLFGLCNFVAMLLLVAAVVMVTAQYLNQWEGFNIQLPGL